MFIIYKRTVSKAIHWENQCHEGRKLLTSSSWPSFARLRCNGHPAFFLRSVDGDISWEYLGIDYIYI